MATLRSLPNVQMWGLDWHCAGNVIATACSDKAVRLYDVDLNKIILTIEQQ